MVPSSQHRSRRISADQLAKSDSNMSRCQCVKLTLCVITLNIWSSQISYKKQQFFCSTTGSFYSGAPELQKFSKRKQNSEGHRNIKWLDGNWVCSVQASQLGAFGNKTIFGFAVVCTIGKSPSSYSFGENFNQNRNSSG